MHIQIFNENNKTIVRWTSDNDSSSDFSDSIDLFIVYYRGLFFNLNWRFILLNIIYLYDYRYD